MIDMDEFINGAGSDVQGLLLPLAGYFDISEQELWAIEPDDEQAVRKVIREHVKPNFMERKNESAQGLDRCNFYERQKEGLRFLINLNDKAAFDWIGNVGQFCLYPCYEHPVKEYIKGDYHTFYLWIWKELCGDEDWRIPDMDVYLQNTNPYAKLQINEDGQWVPNPTEKK